MKVVVEDYTFNPGSKTITFDAFTSISIDKILMITNSTDQTIIYQLNKPSLGGSVATNVLTLVYNTATMDAGDDLLIHYEIQAFIKRFDVTETTTYIGIAYQSGIATSAAMWQIRRFLKTGTEIVIAKADGDMLFDNIWDNRAALSYS